MTIDSPALFWGNKILEKKLPDLISEYHGDRLDRATYRLRIGPEVYVSPTGQPNDPANKPKTILSSGQGFAIPAGQFGFLLTQETVKVPNSAIAFISIRSQYKFRGLINVSGFHVDPGYDGRLIFAVFNAGPAPVHLAQGEECFHIWYATLDGAVEFPPKKGLQDIPSKLINPISGEIQSLAGLNARISENQKTLTEQLNKVQRDHEVMRWAAALIVGVLITLGLKECSPVAIPKAPSAVVIPSAPSLATPKS